MEEKQKVADGVRLRIGSSRLYTDIHQVKRCPNAFYPRLIDKYLPESL